MPLVHYYLGRPASVWIAAMSKRGSTRAQVVVADDSPPRSGSGYGRRMEIAELAHLRRARDLLEREYARPLNVPAMARAALMSPSLFSRRFREAYGETPYAYLQARRVERAMGLLREGDLSVTDVCIAVGFTSLGSFSSTFTRLVGEPPSAYKARDHGRLAPVPPCMTRAWARPGWIAEPCRIGEAPPAARA
jgi:AraC-like DNA-binding protein